MNINLNNAEVATLPNGAADMIEGTGWTWEAAASMAKECAREDRLFGRKQRNRSNSRRGKAKTAARRAANFLKQTGWTMADALSEAIEHRRDARLYGLSIYAQA